MEKKYKMLIYVLIFIQIILLIGTYYCFQKSLFSPSFIFLIGFLTASICAAFFQGKWGEILHWNSFIVYLVGFITFFAVSVVINRLYIAIKSKSKKRAICISKEYKNIEIPTVIYIVFAIIHIIAIYFLIKRVKETAAIYGVYGSWSESVEKYRYIVAFTTNEIAGINIIGKIAMDITKVCGFFWSYIFIYNILSEKRKISILALINLILCIIHDFLGGARTGTVVILIACIGIFYTFWIKKHYNRKKLPFKYIVKICIVLLFIVISFQFLGGVIGRNIDVSFTEYFAKYVGSPMKNLDIFMQQDHQLPNVWGQQTFANFINWIGSKTNNINLYYKLDLPFINYNGFNMGNVYTTFYMFLYDFGMIGVVGCTAVMAAISQLYYELSIGNEKAKPFNIIIYSMILPQLLLCFFSNKFYEFFATTSFIRWAIILKILIWLLLEHEIRFFKGGIKISKINSTIQ